MQVNALTADSSVYQEKRLGRSLAPDTPAPKTPHASFANGAVVPDR